MASGGGPAKSKTGKYIAIGCGVLFMFCCITGIIYQVVCAAMVPGAGGGACARAAECCAAFSQATNAPGTECSTYANMPAVAETGCQATIESWRTALQAANIAVPAACQ